MKSILTALVVLFVAAPAMAKSPMPRITELSAKNKTNRAVKAIMQPMVDGVITNYGVFYVVGIVLAPGMSKPSMLTASQMFLNTQYLQSNDKNLEPFGEIKNELSSFSSKSTTELIKFYNLVNDFAGDEVDQAYVNMARAALHKVSDREDLSDLKVLSSSVTSVNDDWEHGQRVKQMVFFNQETGYGLAFYMEEGRM